MSKPPARLKSAIDRIRRDALARIDRVPVAALVWGPSPTSSDPVALTRVKLRDELRKRGHIADFSEDLIDPKSRRSPFAQQLAQAEAYDVIFSIAGSYGSIAELHDFARIPGVSHKLLAFIDEAHMAGYSGSTLLASQTTASCILETYDHTKLPEAVVDPALEQVYRLQEMYYLQGRR